MPKALYVAFRLILWTKSMKMRLNLKNEKVLTYTDKKGQLGLNERKYT